MVGLVSSHCRSSSINNLTTDYMIFLFESIIACALFTLFVFLMSRDPVKTIFNYPPAIIERCKSLGLVDDSNRPGGPAFYAKKIIALLIFGVLLGLLVKYVNGCTAFWCGASRPMPSGASWTGSMPSCWTACGSATTLIS